MKYVGLALIVATATTFAQDWQPVLVQLRDNSSGKRIEALKRLNEAGYAAAVDNVAPLLTDSDDAVQFAAIDAELTFFLAEPIGESRGRSRAQLAFEAGPLVRAARPATPAVLDHLIAATADGNARIRFDALHAIGVIGEPPFNPDLAKRLLAGLQSSDAVMRTATARVLGRLRASEAGDALIMALNDSNELVQEYAGEALGLLRNDRAVQALTDRVNYYGKGEMANSALLALARIAHPSSRDMLRARMADADPAARRAAIEGLGRLRDRAMLDKVREAAKSDPSGDVRVAGLFALDRLGEPQLAGLCGSLTQPAFSAQARDYLLEVGPAAALAVANALAASTDLAARAELIRVLGYVGGAADARTLDVLTKDPDARVARAAAHALARLRR